MKKIIKILLLTLTTTSLIIADNYKDIFFTGERSTSFGLMSEKLGTDFFNFSWNIYKKDKDEVFVSIGPSIAIPTNVGLGWKHYFESNTKITPFTCISIFNRSSNKMSNNSGNSIRSDNCIGLSGGFSYLLSKSEKREIYINCGVFISDDFRNDPMTLPVINIEFKR